MRTFVLILTAAASLTAQTLDRTKPPATPPIPGYKLPATYETKLPNGLNVVLVEDARFPLVTVRLGFQAGTKFDPKEIPGLAESVAALLTEGTRTRSAQQLAEEMTSIGGSLSGVADPDGLTLNGSALAENAPRLLELLADAARNASFPQEEVELHKQNRKQSLMARRANSGFLAQEKFMAVVYGDSPYARVAPPVAAVDKIDVKSLTAFRDAHLIPNNATLILLGKLPARAEALKLVRARFGDWTQKPLPPAPNTTPPAPRRAIYLVDRPGSVQADIQVGRLGVTRADPDHFPMVAGNIIIGGGMSSRMFNNIREKQGFAYDAHSELNRLKESGVFAAVTQVRNEVIEAALKSVIGEMEAMATAPVTAEELTDAKNFAAGTYLLRLETQAGLADQLNMMKISGLPKDYLDMYTARIRSVEPDQILKAAAKYMAPANAAIVVVGDASKLRTELEKFGEVTVTKAN